jgi:hypothetical protein
VSVLGETLPPGVVPAIIFVLSAATAFATGSSWGTMGILMPLVVPLVWAVLLANGVADPSNYHIIYSTVACVLAGSVWGDHCSPISDTTILSSMASGCDHVEHVRTQLPYALVVGTVAVLIGTLPTPRDSEGLRATPRDSEGVPRWSRVERLCHGRGCGALFNNRAHRAHRGHHRGIWRTAASTMITCSCLKRLASSAIPQPLQKRKQTGPAWWFAGSFVRPSRSVLCVFCDRRG